MYSRTEREILAAHADRLNAGLRGSAAHPPMTPQQHHVLTPLLQLAEWLSDVLVMVEPSPAFVAKLGQELALTAARSQVSLFARYRKAILVMAATLGSALSLAGLVLFYLFRQRDAAQSTTTT